MTEDRMIEKEIDMDPIEQQTDAVQEAPTTEVLDAPTVEGNVTVIEEPATE